MFTNRFSTRTVALVVIAIALICLLTVNIYLVQRRGEVLALDQPQNAQAINPNTYYPLPPGKQTALVNAARQACLNQVHEELIISRAPKPATYYPLPPGKRTALVNYCLIPGVW